MLLDQTARQIALFSLFGDEKADLVLRSFTANEELGRLFQIDAELLSEKFNLSFEKIVGQNATIRLNTVQSVPRYWNGHVSCFRQVGNVGPYACYQAVIVPKLWFLTRSADCRIFQNKTVPDIIKDVFKERGIDPIEDTLTATYPTWEYCVQYRETDFNFVSRLMEQEGIHYYFRHEKGKHTLVLADANSIHQPFPDYATIPLQGEDMTIVNKQILNDWSVAMEVQPSFYTLNDFDFKKPKTSLLGKAAILTERVEGGDHEMFDYPGEYTEAKEGENYAMARIHELNTGFKRAYGQGDVRGICVGCEFTLQGSARKDQNGKYLVISTVIQASAESYFSDTGDSAAAFSCSCTAMQASDVSFVPARVTPKPIIQGVQTAIVTGPKGEEIYTDKYGRVKVQFHWDRKGKNDENTTCFIRVAEMWAGKRWGSTFTPRIGQEVVVSFLEGDPDQPLIVGSVYNGEQMPPYLGEGWDPKHKYDPNVSGVKSCSTKGGQGYNELRFNDTKSKEQVFIHAEKDLDIQVNSEERKTVGGDVHLTVGYADKSGELHGYVKEKIFRSKSTHAKHSVGVHADQQHFIFVGEGSVAQAMDQDGTIRTTADVLFSAKSETIVLDASAEICLTCGPNFIKLTPEAIYINGLMVNINSGGEASLGKGINYIEPLEPDTADDSKSGSPSCGPSSNPAH